ncbi:hypothetical protein FEA48_28190 [Pseudomonas nitroreducens]|uniref:Uncharacterized protein n=1 Tax=Pseudomonas nitroreducens TaxID=46680 RepID=A0A5R8ZV15_PSENT|nr:hypothetical protein [Pseudomonas nitroreducens]TLP69735.1 hypothetical protein FEA48_28190 [Pseudomonas nitroreducens]
MNFRLAQGLPDPAKVARQSSGEVRGKYRPNNSESGRFNYPVNGLERLFHNFSSGKKRPPGEAAKPKDDEVEQSSGRSGAGIRDSCASSGRKLNGDSGKC